MVVKNSTGFTRLDLAEVSDGGILLRNEVPTYGWRDIIGDITPDDQGAGSAVLGTFRGGQFRTYFYSANDRIDCVYHLPHDYALGTDLYLHLHWGHNGTSISGSLVVDFYSTYAKGHNQAAFGAEKNQTLTVSTPNIATIPQYQHRIDEVQLSSAGGSATLLDSDLLEPDGLLLVGVTATTIPTIGGGSTNLPAFFTLDVHYQTTNIGTLNKSPNFYTA